MNFWHFFKIWRKIDTETSNLHTLWVQELLITLNVPLISILRFGFYKGSFGQNINQDPEIKCPRKSVREKVSQAVFGGFYDRKKCPKTAWDTFSHGHFFGRLYFRVLISVLCIFSGRHLYFQRLISSNFGSGSSENESKLSCNPS